MALSCGLPPVDMRYSRVVAVNGQGLDIVAFGADRRPASAPVVAPFSGTVRRDSPASRYGYLNLLVIEVADPSRSRPLFVALSGLAFSGRAPGGSIVRAGEQVGTIEPPNAFSFARANFRTAGADPRNPYLNVEVWTSLAPRFETGRSITGTTYTYVSGAIEPGLFWAEAGIDLVGRRGSQQMLVRAGGPSDPANCTGMERS